MSNYLTEFQKLIDVLDKLLSPDGCEWDREQTHNSLVPYLLEETYEVIEAIESGDMKALKEELGDLILHVLFQAKLAEKENYFNLSNVLTDISSKLVNRHSHVFSKGENPNDGNISWEQKKKLEKDRKSVLEGVPQSLPSLTRARRIQEKASSVGFDWKKLPPIWDKINEEISELKEAIDANNPNSIKDEIGDVIFSIVNLARFLNIDSESSLRHAIKKFEYRFKEVESILESNNKTMKNSTLDEMDKIWNKVKKKQ